MIDRISLPRAVSRRQFLVTALAIAASGLDTKSPGSLLRQLEDHSGGKLGVCIRSRARGVIGGHRASERFGLCSTFKLLLAGVILHEADQGRLSLDERLVITEDDLVPYAPVTEPAIGTEGLTIRELARATQTTSDNVAANKLLERMGGPEGFTHKLRAIGDTTTRLDRFEPEMNFVPTGEVRDTSTPAAMSETVLRLLSPTFLSSESLTELRSWLQATRTGRRRIRAGLPTDWDAGDKTGTGLADGMPDRYNDVAVVWPPGGDEVVISAFYEGPERRPGLHGPYEEVLAEVGRIAAGFI